MATKRANRRGRPLLTPGQWLDREKAAGRLRARLTERQVAFLVDLVVRVGERKEPRGSAQGGSAVGKAPPPPRRRDTG